MANAGLAATLRHIGVLAAAHHSRGRTDRELIQDFLDRNDEAAFAVLVKRHRRPISSSRAACTPRQATSSFTADDLDRLAAPSWRRRRTAARFVFWAMRNATP